MHAKPPAATAPADANIIRIPYSRRTRQTYLVLSLINIAISFRLLLSLQSAPQEDYTRKLAHDLHRPDGTQPSASFNFLPLAANLNMADRFPSLEDFDSGGERPAHNFCSSCS